MGRTAMLAKRVNILRGREDGCDHKTKTGGNWTFLGKKAAAVTTLKGGIRPSLFIATMSE